MSEVVKTSEKNGVLEVRLNRPEVKNAMSAEVMVKLSSIFKSISSHVRVLILQGEGDFFCAGGDLNWMKSALQKTVKENEEDARTLAGMITAIDECAVPVITIVKGGAFGGGVGLVAASDIVIAEDTALFSLSEVKLGLIPATIGPLVMRKIGVGEARRFYLTGMRFSAQEAKSMHLIHEVVKPGTASAKLAEYLKEFSSAGPEAVRHAKALIRQLQAGDLWSPGIADETSKILSKIRVGPEAQEGVGAFLERRKPTWSQKIEWS